MSFHLDGPSLGADATKRASNGPITTKWLEFLDTKGESPLPVSSKRPVSAGHGAATETGRTRKVASSEQSQLDGSMSVGSLGAWVVYPNPGDVPLDRSACKAIPLREEPAAVQELIRRLPLKTARERAYTQSELDGIDSACDILKRVLRRVHSQQPDDLLQICAPWESERTVQEAGVYFAQFLQELGPIRTKLGESEDMQKRTNQQEGIDIRLIFMFCKRMVENGFLLQSEIDELSALPLPMTKGCIKSNKKFEPKVMRQLGTAQYEVGYADGSEDHAKVGEWLFQLPTAQLRRVTDPLEMMEYLENHQKFAQMRKWLKPIVSSFEANTWPTLKSKLAALFEVLDHLHKAHKHPGLYISRHLSLLTVDENKFRGIRDLYKDSPFEVKNMEHLDRIKSLVGQSASRNNVELAKEIGETLEKMDKDDYFPPDDESHALAAKKTITEILQSVPLTCIICIRSSSMDCVRGDEEWYDRVFPMHIELEGPRFEIEGRGPLSGSQISSPMILHRTEDGHIVLEHRAEFVAFSPDKSYLNRFNALQGLGNKAVINYLAGVLSAEGLWEIVQMTSSASLILSGVNSSLSDPTGSWFDAVHYCLPDGLLLAGHVKGAGALKMAFKEEIPYHAILLLMVRLGLSKFNSLLEILGSEYQMGSIGGKWLLYEPRGDVCVAQYDQYNKITQKKWTKPTMKKLRSCTESVRATSDIESIDLSPALDVLFNGKCPTSETNNPHAANQERLEVIVAEVCAESSREESSWTPEIAEKLCKKLEETASRHLNKVRAKWWKNLEEFAEYIQKKHPDGLDRTKVFMPLAREIDSKLFQWYKSAIGFGKKGAEGAVTGIERDELRVLGINFDRNAIERALENRSQTQRKGSYDKELLRYAAQKERTRGGQK